jgi:preprotein translocase subunit SecA
LLGGNPEMIARFEVTQAATPELLADRAAFDAEIAAHTALYKQTCEAERKDVLTAGGLHILGTERHESRRIDNQLRGRGGRQGDPGSSRFYLSLEDDLMRIFAGDRMQVLMNRLGMEEDVPIEHKWVTKAVENAQVKVEQRNFDIRKNLLEYDDVMNQQRKSVYALRKQVLSGQYQSELTKEERERGVQATSLVEQADPELGKLAEPLLVEFVKMFAADPPPPTASQEERVAWRDAVMRESLTSRKRLWVEPLEQQVYITFGCQTDMRSFAENPAGALDELRKIVAHSLTEQRERLLDLMDEIIGTMVGHACPKGKQFEDWDLAGLAKGFDEVFGVPATGLEKHGTTDEIAEKLYKDAQSVLEKRERDIGQLLFLRVFRNFYLQEIDNQWLEHLQNMDSLRDGIGLRGYGQKDPKKEYQKEGFEYFLELMQTIKSSIVNKMFRFEIEREDEVERLEERRRERAQEQQQRLQMTHAEAADGAEAEAPVEPESVAPASRRDRRRAAASGGPVQTPPPPVQTMRRERPKVGRNDPCWCGSGKKYKHCHLRSDTATSVP